MSLVTLPLNPYIEIRRKRELVVIDARRTFRCAHTYVAVTLAGLPGFVCATCGYRTELLPLRMSRALGVPATIVAIGHVDTDRASRTAHIAGGV